MSIFSFLISEFQPQESRGKDFRTSDFCFMRHRPQLSVLPPWGLYQYFPVCHVFVTIRLLMQMLEIDIFKTNNKEYKHSARW
jgi:hypothetical protein